MPCLPLRMRSSSTAADQGCRSADTARAMICLRAVQWCQSTNLRSLLSRNRTKVPLLDRNRDTLLSSIPASQECECGRAFLPPPKHLDIDRGHAGPSATTKGKPTPCATHHAPHPCARATQNPCTHTHTCMPCVFSRSKQVFASKPRYPGGNVFRGTGACIE